MLAILLLTALLIIRSAPDSLPGRALARWLVDWPAAKLARLTRGQITVWLGLGLLLWAGFALLGHETMQVLSMAMPDSVALFATFDMSVVADALVAAALLAAQARLGGVMARLRAIPRRRSRAARPRARRRPRTPKAGNDDDPAADRALAAQERTGPTVQAGRCILMFGRVSFCRGTAFRGRSLRRRSGFRRDAFIGRRRLSGRGHQLLHALLGRPLHARIGRRRTWVARQLPQLIRGCRLDVTVGGAGAVPINVDADLVQERPVGSVAAPAAQDQSLPDGVAQLLVALPAGREPGQGQQAHCHSQNHAHLIPPCLAGA